MAGIDAGGDQGIALQGRALTVAVGRDAHVADQHVRKTSLRRFPCSLSFRRGLPHRKAEPGSRSAARRTPLPKNRCLPTGPPRRLRVNLGRHMTDRVALNLGLEEGENLSADASPVQALARDTTRPFFLCAFGRQMDCELWPVRHRLGVRQIPRAWFGDLAHQSARRLKRTQDFTVISSTISPEAFRRNLCRRRAASRLRASTRAEKAIAKYR